MVNLTVCVVSDTVIVMNAHHTHNSNEGVQAGNFSKALDLAFSTKQFGALQMISSDLDERADPELLERCANFFIDNGQHDKAVDLLAIGKKVSGGPQSQRVMVVSFETWKQKKVEGVGWGEGGSAWTSTWRLFTLFIHTTMWFTNGRQLTSACNNTY